MAILIKYRKKSVNEDDGEEIEKVSNDAVEKEKIIEINKKLADINVKKRAKKTEYENYMRQQDQIFNTLSSELANLGGSVAKLESFKGFGKKLFEAVLNKTDDLYGKILMIFENNEFSRTPDKTWQFRLAKYTIGFINNYEKKTGFGENGEQVIRDFLIEFINKSQWSVSRNEKTKFVDLLIKEMKEFPYFDFIFENKK